MTCCSPWGGKELDTTEQLNNNNKQNMIGKEKKHCSAFQLTRRNLSIYYISLSSPHQRDMFFFFLNLGLIFFFSLFLKFCLWASLHRNQLEHKTYLKCRSLNLSPAMCAHAQPCQTLCKPLDCRSPDFSVPGTLQARILEWIAKPSSRGSSQARDQTHLSCISCIAGRLCYC